MLACELGRRLAVDGGIGCPGGVRTAFEKRSAVPVANTWPMSPWQGKRATGVTGDHAHT